MSASAAREVGKMLKRLTGLGCTVRSTGSGHWLVSRPGYRPVTVAASPSDGRAMNNIRADIRRNLGITL